MGIDEKWKVKFSWNASNNGLLYHTINICIQVLTMTSKPNHPPHAWLEIYGRPARKNVYLVRLWRRVQIAPTTCTTNRTILGEGIVYFPAKRHWFIDKCSAAGPHFWILILFEVLWPESILKKKTTLNLQTKTYRNCFSFGDLSFPGIYRISQHLDTEWNKTKEVTFFRIVVAVYVLHGHKG